MATPIAASNAAAHRERTVSYGMTLLKIRPHALALLVAALLPVATHAQSDTRSDVQRARDAARAYRTSHEATILREFTDLLAMPNVASDRAAIRRNAAHLVGMLERRGIAARIIESGDGFPAVFGELRVPGATRTVALYAHFDGQPVDPANWVTPPWSPTLRDKALFDGGQPIAFPTADNATPVDGNARLYARSASDDKASIIAMLTGLDALRAGGRQPTVNVKFFFEGEEEAGSQHLREILERHKALLMADAWIFCDGPLYQNGRNQVLFGARGVTELELTVYGPTRPLHSGHYGNWAPNPGMLLVNLIASMRDDNGRIKIAGFYDDVKPISVRERKAIAALPAVDSTLRASLGFVHTEAHDARLAERIMLPALNLRGIQVGAVREKSANVISTEAHASFDIRLVPNETPERVQTLVEAHLRAQGWYVTHDSVTMVMRLSHPKVALAQWGHGYPASRVSLELPFSKALLQALSDGADQPPLAVPTIGGSGPTYVFEQVLGTKMLTLPIANYDNNQHAANENIRIQALWNGIELYAALMGRLGAYWPDRPVP